MIQTDNTIRPAIEAMEQAFAQLREHYGLTLGPAPVITVQTAGRRKVLGWFAPEAWSGELPEINLSAEHLARGFDEAMETLVHEMAHWANWTNDVKDCNRAGYHNKEFRRMAEQLGLAVEKMGRHGWAQTSITSELRDIISGLNVNREAFAIARLVRRGEKAPTKMKLWTCGCGVKIRAAVDLDVTCNLCETQFQKESNDG